MERDAVVWIVIIWIVDRCLRLSRDVIARWGWIVGWVVVARVGPHRREVLRFKLQRVRIWELTH